MGNGGGKWMEVLIRILPLARTRPPSSVFPSLSQGLQLNLFIPSETQGLFSIKDNGFPIACFHTHAPGFVSYSGLLPTVSWHHIYIHCLYPQRNRRYNAFPVLRYYNCTFCHTLSIPSKFCSLPRVAVRLARSTWRLYFRILQEREFTCLNFPSPNLTFVTANNHNEQSRHSQWTVHCRVQDYFRSSCSWFWRRKRRGGGGCPANISAGQVSVLSYV